MRTVIDENHHMVDTYGDLLKRILTQKKVSMNELHRRTGISYTRIRALVVGEGFPTFDNQQKIEEALVLPDQTCRRLRSAIAEGKIKKEPLIKEHLDRIAETTRGQNYELVQPPIPRIPVFEINPGETLTYDNGGYPISVADDWLSVPGLIDPHGFACFIRNDSMEPELNDGDIVVFSPAKAIKSGTICFIRPQDDIAAIKRVFFNGDSVRQAKEIRLVSTNRKYPDECIPMSAIMHIWPMYVKIQYPRDDE